MKRYRIIGKSKQMRSVSLFDPEQGRDVQHKIGSGKSIDITEEQMTFHVERQQALGILRIVELEEEVVGEVPTEVAPEPEPEPEQVPWPEEEKVEEAPPEEEEAEPAPKPKKRAKSRRKIKIDLDEEDES